MATGLKSVKDNEEIPKSKLDELYENFKKGSYLGDMRVYFELEAVNVKDFQRFRENAIRRFGGDDWRYLKYLITQDEVLMKLYSLPKYQVKPKPDKGKEKKDDKDNDTVSK
jgi:hypothetical protein